MSHWLLRFVVLLVVSVVAFSAGFGAPGAAAAEEEEATTATRVPKSRLTDKPFRGIVLLTIGDRVVCTGFVVAPTKVATAAHCLVQNASEGDFKLKAGLPRNVRVYRAYSQAFGGSAYRACGVSKVWAHAKFVKGGTGDKSYGSREHDYAVLTTKCTFPRNAMLRLWATEDRDGQLNVGQRIRIAGYPADPRYEGMNGLSMWRTEGRVRPSGSAKRHLHFTGFVASGMSGAPVWRTYNRASPCGRTHCVVAIVTECAINKKGLCMNSPPSDRIGVRITPQVKQLIKRK